ncbi:MAG: glycosyltransferase [Pseudomonadota bacterium]
MGADRVSVIVVSRGRPDELSLCLSALAQQIHPPFEIVVVADPAGVSVAKGHPHCAGLRLVQFDEPNIAAARNAGLTAAGGDIIAFIDDDAFAEPTWLARLVAPFDTADVAATGGFVRGRNGISYQWRARAIDALGQHHTLAFEGDRPRSPETPDGMWLRTEGTNCAYRRSVLAELRGFDPAYRFYLDDADLNVRLGKAGGQTILVPLAQVVHVMAPSQRRAKRRVPVDLHEIGASAAYYLKRHAPGDRFDQALADLRLGEEKRLLRHMVAGTCTPEDVGRLLAGFDTGAQDGTGRDGAPGWDGARAAGFAPIAPAFADSVILSGRPWQARRVRAKAASLVDNNVRVSVFLLSPSTLFHHVRYRAPGYWEQTGGIFGRSVRSERLFSMHSFNDRVQIERQRVAKIRGLPQK